MSDKGRRAAAAAFVAAGASLGVTGVAGTAAAATLPATLTVNKACYITVGNKRPTMVVTGTGYTAGASVSISDTTGTFIANATADASGNFTVSGKAPTTFLSKPGEKRDTITATGFALDGNEYIGKATTHVTSLDASARTRRGRGLSALTFRTRWRFSGFPEGKPIWAHYLYGKKLVARQRFGRAKGPCGLLTVRKRLYPKKPHHRVYRLQLDSRAKYSKHTSPRLVTKVGLELF